LLQQDRRRAAQQQVLPGQVGAVDQHAQHRKQIGRELHLVDDHRAVSTAARQGLQRRQRLQQALAVHRMFQVEPAGAAALHQRRGERALAALSRSGQHDGPRASESRAQADTQRRPFDDHRVNDAMKKEILMFLFHGISDDTRQTPGALGTRRRGAAAPPGLTSGT
jgi:hypothetical protein